MSLYVGHLPKDTTKKQILDQFAQFGQCIVTHLVTHTQGLFAFVEYSSATEAATALKHSQTWAVNGGQPIVQMAKTQPRPEGTHYIRKRSRSRSPPRDRNGYVQSIKMAIEEVTRIVGLQSQYLQSRVLSATCDEQETGPLEPAQVKDITEIIKADQIKTEDKPATRRDRHRQESNSENKKEEPEGASLKKAPPAEKSLGPKRRAAKKTAKASVEAAPRCIVEEALKADDEVVFRLVKGKKGYFECLFCKKEMKERSIAGHVKSETHISNRNSQACT